MAITITLFQRQFDDLSQEVMDISRTLKRFVPHANRQFAYMHESLDELRATTRRIETNMATKDEIANMVVKSDIEDMVVKDDIADMVTKSDLVNMATKQDIQTVQKQLNQLISLYNKT